MNMMDIFKIDNDGSPNYVAAPTMNEALAVFIEEISLDESFEMKIHLLYSLELAEYIVSVAKANIKAAEKLVKRMAEDNKAFIVEEDGDFVFDNDIKKEMLENAENELRKSIENLNSKYYDNLGKTL